MITTPDTYELIGGPQCGLMFDVSDHNGGTFVVPYERFDKKGKSYAFEATYEIINPYQAQYREG